MKFIASLIVLFVLVPVDIYGMFECPPGDEILPCTCSPYPRNAVKCNDVKSIATLQKTLGNHFRSDVPELRITNMHAFRLPSHAFQNMAIYKLKILYSSFRQIDAEAFYGQEESLRNLLISDNRLFDFPAEALKRVPNLQTLSLAGNFIMSIGEDSMSRLSKLRYLVLSDNRVSSIEPGCFPKSVTDMYICRNLLTSLNGTLKDMSVLEELRLTGNRIASVRGELEDMPRLSKLLLDRNNLRDVSDSFKNLNALKFLNVAENSLEKFEPELHPNHKLQHLNASYNYITRFSKEFSRKITGVEILDLSGNYILNICESIKPLKNLNRLYLSNINLQELSYGCFQDMKLLNTLDLSQNKLTHINYITSHSLPGLTRLYLQSNSLQNFRHGLKNLRSLEELDISDNKFMNIKRHQLMHNTALKTFKIGGNSWDCSDYFLEVLESLEKRKIRIFGAPLCYQAPETNPRDFSAYL